MNSASSPILIVLIAILIVLGASLFILLRRKAVLQKLADDLHISQQKFAIAFNSSPDAIFISDQQTGRLIEVNNAIESVFGYRQEEFLGKNTLELDIYKNPTERLKVFHTLKKQGFVHNMEIVGKHKSGRDLNLLISVEESKINQKPCFIITSQDVTELKQTSEKLRKSEERYKSIISVSNTGAWEYHLDTNFLWCSPEYFSMLGRKQSDYDMSGTKNLQETWLDLLHPDDKEKAAAHFAEYLKNGSVETYENYFRMKHLNGDWIWIWSRGQTLPDENGNPTNLTVGTHIDITERIQTEMELQKLNTDKDRFISILSHDLRSPFNGIVGILELLRSDFQNLSKDDIEELLKMATKSAHNASELLDDVLIWAMAQSGKMTFTPTDINFKTDCMHVIEILQAVAETKNISIVLDSQEDLTVFADKNMLQTILRNLISNAIKFTNEGGKIIVSALEKRDNVTISITDNGIGIDSENIQKIFDKTAIFTSKGTADEKGTGFGLKLCQEFVEKHGGSIWLESEPGKGTTFYFSLPHKNS